MTRSWRRPRDLAKRDRARRKIIFIISDGREQGSTASYKDTLKVLLTQNITVYAVGVEGAAIPVYDRLQRIHLPKTGRADGLQRHSAEIRQRNRRRHGLRRIGPKPTSSGPTPAPSETPAISTRWDIRPRSGIGGYREIEVQVRRPDVKVYAKRRILSSADGAIAVT